MKRTIARPEPPGGKGLPASSKRKLMRPLAPARSRAPSGDNRAGSAKRRRKGGW